VAVYLLLSAHRAVIFAIAQLSSFQLLHTPYCGTLVQVELSNAKTETERRLAEKDEEMENVR